MGYSPWSHKELDMTEQLGTHTYIHTYIHIYMCVCVYIYIYMIFSYVCNFKACIPMHPGLTQLIQQDLFWVTFDCFQKSNPLFMGKDFPS